MKKRLLSFIIGAIMAVSCVGMTACGSKESVKDGKTITVKVFKAGYGTAWIYKAKEKFEEVYKSEGYKVNILKPDNSLKGNTALADMRTGTKSGVDLYFIQSVSVANAIDAEYGSSAEDLTDIYNLPAISFDGTEEDVKISQKLSSTYNESVKSDDKYYSFLWASSPCGLVANKKVLQKYGKTPENLTKGFACLMALYKITAKGEDGKYCAKLPALTIEMKDDEKYLEYFANGGCVIKFMQDESVWGEDLTKYEGFAAAVKTIVKKLRSGDTDIL